MTTKELVENFRFKEKTTRRDSCGSGEQNKREIEVGNDLPHLK